MKRAVVLLALLVACEEEGATDSGGGGATSATGGAAPSTGGGGSEPIGGDGGGGGVSTEPETPPEPSPGPSFADPPSRSLHNHGCGGVDWQRIHGWVLLPHAAPEIGSAEQFDRCVERYEGWVTNEADAASVSRASVYAALAATGQCDAEYDGKLLSGDQCTLVHPELDASECADEMVRRRSFGISTVAKYLAATVDEHESDVPLMGAMVGHGSIECGGDDRWQILAPEGFLDSYLLAYNAYKASSSDPPVCDKRIVVTVALYTGMDDPGQDGVTPANGCWTFERVSKQNDEWKICNYDGTVTHAGGVKWVYDDTSTNHSAATEENRIEACRDGVEGRGYVYMTNRGSGWPKVVTDGVDVHFAEVYSGQFAVADQLSAWRSGGKPGEPMVHFGEATTSATTIRNVTADVCSDVADGGYLGVYVYPESLRGGRMSAMVEALNSCTE